MPKLVASAAADMEKMERDSLIHHIKTVTMKSQSLNAQEIATECKIHQLSISHAVLSIL